MAFKATVSIDGALTDVNLLHCSYSMRRDVDATGRPSGRLYGGTIQMEIESTDNTSILEWMVDPYTRKAGTIKFYKDNENAKMKELKFEDGYVIQFAESIDTIGSNPMTVNFTVSAKKISMENAEHVNEWPV
jgi:hypothetical protein